MFVFSAAPPTHSRSSFFFFNDTATTEIYTLSLHDALPILGEDGVIPGGDRLSRAALRVEPHEVRAAVLGRGDDHRLAVRRPDRGARAAAAARWRLVADHVSAHVEVVVGREIPSSTVP